MTTNSSLLVQSTAYTAQIFRRTFLVHAVAGLGLFLLLGATLYLSWLNTFAPSVKMVSSVVVLLGVGVVCFAYTLVASLVYALHLACGAWEDFIDETIGKVQENILSRVENLQEGIAKDQAKVLVRGSVREVFESARRTQATLPKWFISVCLGAFMLVVRAVLTARVLKLAGTTVKISKVFAGKATLVGAVFLNLRLFTTLLLWIIYGMGGIILFLIIGFILR